MSFSGLGVSELSLRDALDLAVLIEEEAHDRYVELTQQMEQHRTDDAARFFRFMARNERKHGLELAERRAELFGSEQSAVSRAMLWDVEAPDLDSARAYMTARQAMYLALDCEKKAHAFFTSAIPQIHDTQVRELFEELCSEEVHHQDLILAEITKLPPDDELRTEDFEDEPNAQ